MKMYYLFIIYDDLKGIEDSKRQFGQVPESSMVGLVVCDPSPTATRSSTPVPGTLSSPCTVCEVGKPLSLHYR